MMKKLFNHQTISKGCEVLNPGKACPFILERSWGDAGKILFFIVAFFLSSNVFAQQQRSSNAVRLVQYIFDAFMPGTIKTKSGETYKQNLNYNIITNEMVFDENGKYAAIANPKDVDTVFINDRKYIPVNNKFYEVLVSGNMPLLYESTASVIEPGVTTGYGGTTTTTAASSYQSLLRDGGAYSLKLPDGYSVIAKHEFYIMKDGKLEKAGSEKQLSKVFPDKKAAIRDLSKKNNTDFSKREDVAALVKEIEK
jgi:hypothetical protein